MGCACCTSPAHAKVERLHVRVVVIGGGPAGLFSAMKSHELGAETVLLERGRLGGVAWSEGPPPVRTLARVARLLREARSWERFGLRGQVPAVDLGGVVDNACRTASAVVNHKGVHRALEDAGVTVVEAGGQMRFLDPNTAIAADGRRFEGDRFILCVGGQGRRLGIPGGELTLSYSDVLHLHELPRRIAVVGGADTGCQLASIFRDFGAEVTLLEFQPRLLPSSDADVAQAVAAAYMRRGVSLCLRARTETIERTPDGLRLRYEQDARSQLLEVDAVFAAVGWPANLAGLGLEAAEVAAGRGRIVVDEFLRTTAPHIYAAGDATGLSMLAQSAALQAGVAVENAVLGPHRRYCSALVAAGSFTDPEYAGVGLTGEQAAQRGGCIEVVAPYHVLTRAIIEGLTEGFCKVIADRHSRELLGVHVVGAYSAEVIQVAATAIAARLRVEQVAGLPLAFPSMAQGLTLAAARAARELGQRTAITVWDTLEAN
jgi:pyruvate/2-oxoglutarate dehydrogenase complex dihydrolipoamide dehydrogenase (E3) component